MTAGNYILADGRWSGAHGIGRFSTEVLSRLQNADVFTNGPKPLSLQNLVWQPYQLYKQKVLHKVFFTPGFNPVLSSPLPFVFTIHDLIHLYAPGKGKLVNNLFYEILMKPAIRQAYKIITVSEFSKKTIIDWSGVDDSKIVVVKNGISENLTLNGERHQPGYPYLLHVGNTKAHKNVTRLIQAFTNAKIDAGIKLILTGVRTPELSEQISTLNLESRIVFSGKITEEELAKYYRGAVALTFPSLYEGFGLPPLEAMACGTPVLTSNITSLPEVTGDAALLIDPYYVDSISNGIEQIVNDASLRAELISKGLQHIKLFSWDNTTEEIQKILHI